MMLVQNLKKLYARLFKGAFAKNVAMVAGGTVLAQLIGVILYPITSRLYSPEEFGVLSLYSAVLSMIVIAASLKYEWSIPIAESNDEVINIVALSLLILILIASLLNFLLVVPTKGFVIKIIGQELFPYRLLLPVGVFLTGLYEIILQIGYRERVYKTITKTKLTQVITGESVKIGLGVLGIGSTGLILGNIFRASAGFFSLAVKIVKSGKYGFRNVSLKEIKSSAKRYKDFPIFSAPGQILNSAGLNLPKIFLASLYGIEVVGAFGFASGVIALPGQLIGNSIADVFYGEAAKLRDSNPRRLKILSLQLLKKLLVIGFFPFISLIFLGPALFSFVFGASWEMAGKYAQILAGLVYARLVFMPFSRIFSIFEKQKIALFLDILRVCLVVITFVFCKVFGLDEFKAIALYTISMSFVYMTTFIMVQLIITKRIKKNSQFKSD